MEEKGLEFKIIPVVSSIIWPVNLKTNFVSPNNYFFSSVQINIARGLSAWEVGVMTEGNISYEDKKKSSCYCIYYPNMLKTYQRETNSFEFSGDRE